MKRHWTKHYGSFDLIETVSSLTKLTYVTSCLVVKMRQKVAVISQYRALDQAVCRIEMILVYKVTPNCNNT